MKIAIAAAVVAVVLGVLLVLPGRSMAGPPGAGRYQLLAGHVSLMGRTDTTNAVVFKIDTATGETWTYYSGTKSDDRGWAIGWTRVPDTLEQ